MTETPSTADASTSPGEVLDREFLKMRADVLNLAAALDRADRAAAPAAAGVTLAGDPRWATLRTAVEALLADGPGRAERVQLLFSLPYDQDWRERFDLVDESTSVTDPVG